MAAEIDTAETTAPGVSFWAFREENEWEGETWTSYFEVPEAHFADLVRLKELLDAEPSECPYELRRVKEIPTIVEEEEADEDYEEGDEDYDDDWDDDDEPERYHPARAVYDLSNFGQVTKAIHYFENGGFESGESDPLYKLGLFDG